jgi:hypothetical protein
MSYQLRAILGEQQFKGDQYQNQAAKNFHAVGESL